MAPIPTKFETRLFLNNEFVDAQSGETFSTKNPYDESEIPAKVHVAGPEDIALAVKYSTAAYKGEWSTFSGLQRAKLMYKFAELLEKNASEIAALDALNMGAPAMFMGRIIGEVAEVFRYYAGWADKIEGESFDTTNNGTYSIIRQEPLGVCAGIAPWNAPILYIGWKIAPALATGNTFIFKSSEKSPLSTLFVARLFKEAGFPPGVVQFVSGPGSVGALLASDMHIQKISFTGSTATGKVVSRLALESNMKRVTLELGGKSGALVFADADLANTVGQTADGFLVNAAQVCAAGSRVFVQESIAPAYIAAVKERFRFAAENMGNDPSLPTTMHGPLADKAQFERVMGYIAKGKAELEPIIGGAQHGTKGYFIQPTIFVDANRENKMVKEEIFGPVLNIKTFKTEEEAIEMANDTVTGLAAQIHTSDISRALRVAAKLEAGNVAINQTAMPSRHAPFGGFKESGSGKELGKYGLQAYLQTKTVTINMKMPPKA